MTTPTRVLPSLTTLHAESQQRVVIENLSPQVDCGRFAIKRVVGERVEIEVDVFTDGHDVVAGNLLYRKLPTKRWQRVPLTEPDNDRWRAAFRTESLGRYEYTVEAWVDPFDTWRRDLKKRIAAGQDIALQLQIGAKLVEEAASRAKGDLHTQLSDIAARLFNDGEQAERYELARDPGLQEILRTFPHPESLRRYPRALEVIVERERARCSAWYEFFPRSCGQAGKHGSFKDCEKRLEYAARMGFDIIYLPPIHPIGHAERKGPNNHPQAQSGDHGSPWAIGSAQGGHKAIHPELGTMEDFHRLVRRARKLGMEIALDIAFQCAPDHPYVSTHPEWFKWRPDGTVQYAENPPKLYQDIYPFDFESSAWQSLWQELRAVIRYWIEQGVTIFRVDNPHTKAFRFWEWCIASLKAIHPETIFLAEAFTRPKVMHHLAKLGFSQSYTYFTWRTGKAELIEYFTELSQSESREYFRPCPWPNTPDILHEYLQLNGRTGFMIRFLLAATLAANYGIYGPSFELGDNQAVRDNSEEYLNSEKYQLRDWNVDSTDSLAELISLVNRIRKQHPALQNDWSLRFHPIDNEQLIAFSKRAGDDLLLVVITLDAHQLQWGWLELPPLGELHTGLQEPGFDASQPYTAHDLLSDVRYDWRDRRNYIQLGPHTQVAHIFQFSPKVRDEQDFPGYA